MSSNSLIESALEKTLLELKFSLVEIFENAQDLKSIKDYENNASESISWNEVKRDLDI
jgi:hypothetical protein